MQPDHLRTKTSIQDKSTSQSGGGVALVASLRQQVHSLERALREKEGQVTELREGVAASRLREMEIQTETYYREICRYACGFTINDGGVIFCGVCSLKNVNYKKLNANWCGRTKNSCLNLFIYVRTYVDSKIFL